MKRKLIKKKIENVDSRRISGKNGLSETIVNELLPLTKISKAENHKNYQKKGKKATKRRQKSDKLSPFQIPCVAFCRPRKKAIKRRQKRQFVAFSFCRCPPQVLAAVFWQFMKPNLYQILPKQRSLLFHECSSPQHKEFLFLHQFLHH